MRAYLGHLRWLSRHDVSTRLPNRNGLFDALAALSGKRRSSDPHCLVAISIENIMELKSAFGFAIIEEATRQLAQRLKNGDAKRKVYHTDTAQLAVLLHRKESDFEPLIDELADAARQPILYDEIPVHVDTRMGYVAFDVLEQAPESYLKQAETALAEAYDTVQESAAFSPEIVRHSEENLAILGELQEALSDGQLSLHYQPKVALATGHVHGAEALMRWKHPQHGDIPPAFFIPRAEQSTLIHQITEFALDQAMAQAVRWRQEGIDMTVAVNISPQNLIRPGFVDLVLDLLGKHGLGGDSLELEITERALMVDMERIIEELALLADAKLIISIDDFGTGYSSLQYLHRLPASLIKIDQSFVFGLPESNGASHIVGAAIMLAHKMGIQTIAEGVETKEAYEFLKNFGCDIAQGFLVSRPLQADAFTQWYKERNGIYRPGLTPDTLE